MTALPDWFARKTPKAASLHEFTLDTLEGAARSLGDYSGKTLLLVNVASQCGLTPQYAGLQRLYERFSPRNFEVLAFPCNQFKGQEPGAAEQIRIFCEANYSISFPLFAKLDVNGRKRHPLYAWLCAQQTSPEAAGDVQWNFGKFVVDGDGRVVGRFEPPTDPEAPELVACIEACL
ncbi:MAG: glutathione peroxidase [Planctomycetota bacterium]|jgi:glutathione peroxidase